MISSAKDFWKNKKKIKWYSIPLSPTQHFPWLFEQYGFDIILHFVFWYNTYAAYYMKSTSYFELEKENIMTKYVIRVRRLPAPTLFLNCLCIGPHANQIRYWHYSDYIYTRYFVRQRIIFLFSNYVIVYIIIYTGRFSKHAPPHFFHLITINII